MTNEIKCTCEIGQDELSKFNRTHKTNMSCCEALQFERTEDARIRAKNLTKAEKAHAAVPFHLRKSLADRGGHYTR
jgi:hypothetical protein